MAVTASGTGPFVYQWYRGVKPDTSSPVGTGGPSFTTPALTATTSYWVRISNACGAADSATVSVAVYRVPTLVQMQTYVTPPTYTVAWADWPAPTTPGNLLVAAVVLKPGSFVSAPAGWTAWSVIKNVSNTEVRLFRIENASSRSGTETFQLNLVGNPGVTTLLEYSGVATSTALDQTATAKGTTATASSGNTLTTTYPFELVLGFFGNGQGTTFSNPTNGFSLVTHGSGAIAGAVYQKNVTQTGSYGHAVTVSAPKSWVGIVQTYRAAQVP